MCTYADGSRLDFDAYITVLVGKEEKSYMVHEGVITNHSRFFRAACSGQFKEAQERVVCLPETDPKLFSAYLQHVYTDRVVIMAPEEAAADKAGTSQYIKLSELYVLADKLDDLRLRNDIVDCTIQLEAAVKTLPSPAAIRIAYEEVPESCLLRKLMRDFYTCKAHGKWLQKSRSKLPADFIFGVACSVREGPSPRTRPRCEYHEHSDEHPKCSEEE